MDDSGGPWRSLRIAQAYMFSGTWPSGGISPSSYSFFNGTGCDLGLAIADITASWRASGAHAGAFDYRFVAVCRNLCCTATDQDESCELPQVRSGASVRTRCHDRAAGVRARQAQRIRTLGEEPPWWESTASSPCSSSGQSPDGWPASWCRDSASA